MPKRKRSHITSDEETHQDSPFDSPEFRLSLLPDEVLIRVFGHLNPVDQVSIERLGWTRYRDLVCDGDVVKVTDFSQVNTVRQDVFASYFTERRALHIRKLILNDLFFVGIKTMIRSIGMCKGLTHLSVANWDFTGKGLQQVLKNAKDLRELRIDYDFFNQIKRHYVVKELDDSEWKAERYNAFIEDVDEAGEEKDTFLKTLSSTEIYLTKQEISFKDTSSGEVASLSLWLNEDHFKAV